MPPRLTHWLSFRVMSRVCVVRAAANVQLWVLGHISHCLIERAAAECRRALDTKNAHK